MSYCSSRHQNLAYPLSMGHHTVVLCSEGHIQCTLPNYHPFLSKCALKNALPLLLGIAVSKKFKTPHFNPIGSQCVTPDKGRMTHQTLVIILCSLEIYCRFSDFQLGVSPGFGTFHVDRGIHCLDLRWLLLAYAASGLFCDGASVFFVRLPLLPANRTFVHGCGSLPAVP